MRSYRFPVHYVVSNLLVYTLERVLDALIILQCLRHSLILLKFTVEKVVNQCGRIKKFLPWRNKMKNVCSDVVQSRCCTCLSSSHFTAANTGTLHSSMFAYLVRMKVYNVYNLRSKHSSRAVRCEDSRSRENGKKAESSQRVYGRNAFLGIIQLEVIPSRIVFVIRPQLRPSFA